MENTLTVARFTLQEAISRRLVLAAACLSVAFIGLYGIAFYLFYGIIREQAASGRERAPDLMMTFATAAQTLMGLYAVYFLVSAVALFMAVGAISGEIDGGTLHAVLARPLRRSHFLIGRWLAYAALMTAYVVIMTGSLLAIARGLAGYHATDPYRTMALLVFEALLLVTISLLGSTFLSTLANGVAVFSLFAVAWLAGTIEFIGTLVSNSSMVNLAIAVSLIVPSDGLWRAASYYASSPAFLLATSSNAAFPFAANSPPTTSYLVWAAAYLVVCLVGAISIFSRRDI